MERNINETDYSNVHRLPVDRVVDTSWRGTVDKISDDISSLWDKERLLIRSELNEKVTEAKNAITSIAVGAALCFVGIMAAVFAAIYVLDIFMPLWMAAVAVTAVLFLVGVVMISIAKKRLDMDRLRPRHSLETLDEIRTTLKERVHEFRH
jgi:hypothetical protein